MTEMDYGTCFENKQALCFVGSNPTYSARDLKIS